jgi:hypothetical protein
MTYIAAWLLLSLLGLAAWFCLTQYMEDDDVYETTAAHDVPSLRPIHGQRALSDAGEENDAAIGSLAATNIRSE